MPKIYLFLILALPFAKLNAQKNTESDYIITLNGEQIRGEVKLQCLRENQKGCVFKAQGQNQYQTYTPAQLQAFYTRKIYFGSKILPDSSSRDERLFLECYLKGKYSLYGKGKKLYIEYDQEPLRPISISGGVFSKDSILVKRADKEFLELLQRLSSECAELGLQIQANVRSYDLKSFLDLLEDYHKCLKLPHQRFVISNELYQIGWEAGAALGMAGMPLKSAFLSLGYYDLISHQGIGFSINGAMVLSPQRYLFFPSLIFAPEWAKFAFQQNGARFSDESTSKNTYVESQYQAAVFAMPIYLREPILPVKSGFLSLEFGTRLESAYSFSKIKYLIESEGTIDQQYTYVSTSVADSFEKRDQNLTFGVITGLRLSVGDRTNSMGRFALGFRYNRCSKKDPNKGDFDHPILLRNTSYSVYFTAQL